MRRFDYDDNEDYREDVDNFFGDGEEGDASITPDEYKAIVQEEQAMQQLQIDLVYRELNDRLMFRAVKMLEKTFWWKFYSLDKKLRIIEKTCRRLKKISERE